MRVTSEVSRFPISSYVAYYISHISLRTDMTTLLVCYNHLVMVFLTFHIFTLLLSDQYWASCIKTSVHILHYIAMHECWFVKQKAFINLGSPVVPLLSTSKADSGLASEFRRDRAVYTAYERMLKVKDEKGDKEREDKSRAYCEAMKRNIVGHWGSQVEEGKR